MTTFFERRKTWTSITEKQDLAASHIEQHLADKDINSKVTGNKVQVHSSNVAAAKRHIKAAGYDHEVIGGLNEGWGAEGQRASAERSKSAWDATFEKHKDNEVMTRRLKHLHQNNWKAEHAEAAAKKGHIPGRFGEPRAFPGEKLGEAVGDDVVNKTEKLRKAGAKEMSIKDKILSIPRGFKAMAAGKSEDDRRLKEEEQIDEISKKTLGSYVKNASRELIHIGRAQGREGPESYTNYKSELGRKSQTRRKGIDRATNKLTSEEALDEISKSTLDTYVHKSFAAGNVLHKQIDTETDPAKRAELRAKLSKRNTGVIAAAKKLRNENIMQMASINPNITNTWPDHQLDEVMTQMQKLRDAHERHLQKALAANKAGDDEATKVHQQYMQKITAKMNKLKQNEEVEELDELDKSTLGSYVNKAHDQLMKHTGTVNMKYGRGDKDATAYALDKDALRKTANRTQGMKTALKKLTKEEA